MRSTLSAVLSATAISTTWLGCDGPLIATVGRVSAPDSSSLDAAVPDSMPALAEAGQSPPLERECVVLPSILEVTFADEIVIDGVTASLLPNGCNASTADGLLISVPNFHTRIDGALLVQTGRRYSLRWPSTLVGLSYRLFGGPTSCPEHELVNAQPDGGDQLASDPGCQEFTAPVDALYLGFGNGSLERVTLCRGQCDSVDPAN